jgi:AhpC/TSA family protein
LPSIDALFRRLEKDGLSVLLIDIREDRETVRRTVQSRGYAAPVLMDADARLSDTYGVRGTPTVFLVGRDGTLRGRAVGPRPWTGPEGRALLQALLAEPAPGPQTR